MTEQYSNNASTTLSAEISTTDGTSISVTSAAGFPSSAQYRIIIDSEIMIVTAGAGTTTWTVTRGAESTTAATHSNGATVTHILTAAGLLALHATDALHANVASEISGVTEKTIPVSADMLIIEDSEAANVKKMVQVGTLPTYAQLLAMQLVNEIKGWPPVVQPDADLVTLNLWWDDAGTPTTKATVVDVAGEAGITETYELALKCAGDGAGDGLMQRYTYADEPRLKSGRVCSALLAIWSVSSVSVTAKLLNSDASETAASAVTAAAWTIVEIPNHTLAGTYCDLQVTAGASGTFYVVPLGLCIGARGLPLAPRPTRYVDQSTDSILNNVDPGGAAYADLDVTAQTSPLAFAVRLHVQYRNTSAAPYGISARRNGDTAAGNSQIVAANATTASVYWQGWTEVFLDDAQIFEWISNAPAANAESLYMDVVGWREWA